MATIGHQSINIQGTIYVLSATPSYGPVAAGCYALVQISSNASGGAGLTVGIDSAPVFSSASVSTITTIYVGPGSTVSASGTGGSTLGITGVLFSNS